MARVDGSARVWLMGLCLSVVLHAGLAAGAILASSAGWLDAGRDRPGAGTSKPTLPASPPPQPPEAEREITLGRSESTRTTLAWLGFVEETEHSARLGVTDQSAMTLNAAGSAEASPGFLSPVVEPEAETIEPVETVAASIPPMVEPRVQPQRSPTEARRIVEETASAAAIVPVPYERASDPTTQPEAARSPAIGETMGPPVPSAAELAAAREEAELAARQGEIDAAERTAREAAERQQREAGARQESSESRVADARPRRPQVRGAGGLPGLASDREAIATAIRSSPIVRPGQVVASRGLDVRTVAPRWSMTAQLTVRPRNPTVYVTFGRDGRVREAGFVRDGEVVLDAGREEINEPLLNAVYNWTARGLALEELDPDDPAAEVTLLFTIMLVR